MARPKDVTVRPKRRIPRRTADPDAVLDAPADVLRPDDDPRVAAMWEAMAAAYAGRLDALQWATCVGAIELLRTFYARGSAPAWLEFRRTVNYIDAQVAAVPENRPGGGTAPVIRLT